MENSKICFVCGEIANKKGLCCKLKCNCKTKYTICRKHFKERIPK